MADAAGDDLTTLALLKAWADPSIDASRDTELEACIDRASVWVEEQSAWDIGARANRSETFDGDDIQTTTLFLPSRYRYVTNIDSVTENGTALTVAEGYDTSADVIATGLDLRHGQARLQRRGSWSAGIQNIVVQFDYGYATASVPKDIVQLANEVAWLMFKSPHWIGRSTVSKAGHSATLEQSLTPLSMMTLERLRQGY